MGSHYYGRDQGILIIDGPWLIFEGLRSRFSIERSHVTAAKEWPKNMATPFRSGWMSLLYAVDGKLFEVAISPQNRIKGSSERFEERFYSAADNWPANWAHTDVGPALYPPAAYDPALAKSFRLINAALGLFYAGLIGLLAASSAHLIILGHELNNRLVSLLFCSFFPQLAPLLVREHDKQELHKWAREHPRRVAQVAAPVAPQLSESQELHELRNPVTPTDQPVEAQNGP